MKAIRDIYGEFLKEYGEKNKNIVVLDADVSGSTKSGIFGKAFPERFFNMGVAEANMIGYAAGMSTVGKVPFVNTFAVFMINRGADMIRNGVCYGGLNVKFAGGYAGASDSYDGATHHAIEDISFMRTLPKMKVLVPCDQFSTRALTKITAETEGPIYLRLSRAEMKDIYSADTKFEWGGSHTLREGKDCTLLAHGYMVHKALEAAEVLQKEHNISARVIDCYSLKPIDAKTIIKAAQETKCLISIEEHLVNGGLGSIAAEVLSEHSPARMKRIGFQDTFTETGAYEALLSKYGLGVKEITLAIKDFCKK